MSPKRNQLSFLNFLLFSLAAGIALANFISVPAGIVSVIGGLTAILAAALVYHGSERTWIALSLLFFVLGFSRFALAKELPINDISFFAGGEETTVRGRLRDSPRTTPAPDGKGVILRFTADVDGVSAGGVFQKAEGGLYVSLRAKNEKSLPKLGAGDDFSASGRLRKLHGYKNPGMIDTVRLARARGVTARLSVGGGGLSATSEGTGFIRRIGIIRERYARSMRESMPAEDAAAIFAMLFGGYDGIKPELSEAFTVTGIVHILSVSGSHTTLLAGVAAWLGAAVGLGRKFLPVFVLAAIFSYVALAGFASPAVRAGIMGALVFVAAACGRESDSKRLLTLTAIFMLLYDPWLLFDVSFELSFASTAGLIYISPRIRELLFPLALPRALLDSFALTFGANLSTLPIIAWYFHVVSLSSFLANLIAVPIVELIIVIGLFAGIAGAVFPLVSRAVFAADSLLLGFVYELTRLLSRLPFSQVYLPAMNAAWSAVYYAALALLLQEDIDVKKLLAPHRDKAGRAAAVFAAGLIILAGYSLSRPKEMAVHFIDVQQGDACLITTPHGRAFMIDTGGTRERGFDVGARVDVPYLLHYGVHSLDFIFLTHAHEDHAAGTAGIIRRLPVGHVVTAGEGRNAYRASTGLSESEIGRARFMTMDEGARITLDGVTIELLFSPDVSKAKGGGNEFSNVYRVSYGDASFLFTGDLVKTQEAALLKKADPKSTVLKVAHHGSRTSSSPEFLAAASPRWAVISVGEGNSFGHPAKETVAALENAGAKILRTDKDGAIVFRTNGKNMRIETYAGKTAEKNFS